MIMPSGRMRTAVCLPGGQKGCANTANATASANGPGRLARGLPAKASRSSGATISQALRQVSQRQGPTFSAVTSRVRSRSSSRVRAGAAAAYPSVRRRANAPGRTSTARGGSGPGGAARAVSAASRTPLADSGRSPPSRPERLQAGLAGLGGVEGLQAPGRAEHRHPGACPATYSSSAVLPRVRLAADRKHPALARPASVNEPSEHGRFVAATRQRCGASSRAESVAIGLPAPRGSPDRTPGASPGPSTGATGRPERDRRCKQ